MPEWLVQAAVHVVSMPEILHERGNLKESFTNFDALTPQDLHDISQMFFAKDFCAEKAHSITNLCLID